MPLTQDLSAWRLIKFPLVGQHCSHLFFVDLDFGAGVDMSRILHARRRAALPTFSLNTLALSGTRNLKAVWIEPNEALEGANA
eukprot:5542752-Karenia_brevis.AAC.1